MHEGSSIVKRYRHIHFIRDYELLQIEEEETFDNFYVRFSKLVNNLCNIDDSLEREK